jgi:Ca2+/Na+ antiporter
MYYIYIYYYTNVWAIVNVSVSASAVALLDLYNYILFIMFCELCVFNPLIIMFFLYICYLFCIFFFTISEEWVTKKKVELTTKKQIETRVKRQVVLEDGKIVEDSGPIVTTNTTEDTEKQEHQQTEVILINMHKLLTAQIDKL